MVVVVAIMIVINWPMIRTNKQVVCLSLSSCFVFADTDETGLATRRNLESVKAGERLGEAIEIAWAEDGRIQAVPEDKRKKGDVGPPNPFLMGKTPSRYILHTLRQIKAPELEQALLLLPLELVQRLLNYLSKLLDEGVEVELCWRCIVFVLRIHHNQIVANRALVTTLEKLRSQSRERLTGYRDLLGYNMAALGHLKRQAEADRNAYVIDMNATPAFGDHQPPQTKKPKA